MSRWFALEEADDAFLETAPLRYRNVIDVAADTRTVWKVLTADDALVSWTAMITGMRWTSAPPYAVGATRDVTVARMVTVRELYHRWDEGSRKTFSVTESNRPGLRRFAEDYLVEPTVTGARVTWTIAVEPSPLLAPLLRLAHPLTRRVTRGWARGLAARLAS